MYQIISQIVLYITAASVIGFIIGWLFFKLLSRENSESLVNMAHDELAKVKASKNEVEDELIAKSNELIKISEDNDKLKRDYLSIEMDYEELLKKSSDIDSAKVNEIEDENFSLKQEIQKNKTIINRVNDSLKHANNDISILKNELNKTNDLKQKIALIEEDKYKFINSIDHLKNENRFLIQKLENSERDKVELKSNITDLKQRSNNQVSFDKKILQEQILQLRNQNMSLTKKLASSKESDVREINNTLVQKITSLENANKLLKQELVKSKEDKSKLSINIDKIEDKISQKRLDQYNSMKLSLAKLEEKNNTLVMKIASFQENNMELKSIINDLKNEKKELEPKDSKVVENIKSELNSLRGELKYLYDLKSNQKKSKKIKSSMDIDRQIHIVDRDKILNFKMDDSYISQIFKD